MTVDTDAQVQHILNQHEIWAADGNLVTTFVRRHRLRFWTRDQFEELLRDSGFERVQSFGADDEFLVVGFAPRRRSARITSAPRPCASIAACRAPKASCASIRSPASG